MSTATEDPAMRALYVKGASAAVDEATLLQLRSQAPELDVTVAANSTVALVEVRQATGWHALLISPALAQNETLAIIAALRRDRVPIAIGASTATSGGPYIWP